MLNKLRLRDFKSFEDATLVLGALTVVIGVNASGKSNIRDALRFLHGIGRGYSVPEIIGGRYGEGGYREWSPMRGAANEIVRFGRDRFTIGVEIGIPAEPLDVSRLEYEITVSRGGTAGQFVIEAESLQTADAWWKSAVFQTIGAPDDPDDMDFRLRAAEGARGQGKRVTLRRDRPALSQLSTKKGVSQELRSLIRAALAAFSTIRFLDLSAEAMRQPSFPGQTVLGESGENLATVLQAICRDPERKQALLAWVSELTPREVADFAFETDATGRVLFFIVDAEGGRVSSLSASDGTLRFLAMAVALLDKAGTGLFFFEELDNGLHPSRMRVLVDLIERSVARSSMQVVTTTHSPDLLTIGGDKTFESTSVVYRGAEQDSSLIRRIVDMPEIRRFRDDQTLGRLHASGWFEDALYFSGAAEAAE